MNASHEDYRNDATCSMRSRISFKSGVFKVLQNTSLLLLACSGAAFGQIYPKGEWDRCGKNLHPTPTSNFCVSVPNELEKGSFGYMWAKNDIKGYAGESNCSIKKGEYVVLLPPGGVEDGVTKLLFASKDGCIAKLRFHFLK